MAKKKKTKRRTRAIITGYLERISAKVFDDYSGVITDMIKGHQGVYSLYKKDKLYYVGLASNLKTRIRHHLKDKHKGNWNYFSLYIIRKEGHIKEMESLVLRIAYPKGNKVRGKLKGSKNLRPKFKRLLTEEWKRRRGEIMDTKKTVKSKKKKAGKKSTSKADKPLRGMFPKGKRLTATYKGKDYKAWAFNSGTIKLKSNGKLYKTPSGAAKAIVDRRTVNGWGFWKYKNKKGKLVKLRELL